MGIAGRHPDHLLCGLIIGRVRVPAVRVAALLVAILGGVDVLVYYKYWNLLADSLGGTLLTRRTICWHRWG